MRRSTISIASRIVESVTRTPSNDTASETAKGTASRAVLRAMGAQSYTCKSDNGGEDQLPRDSCAFLLRQAASAEASMPSYSNLSKIPIALEFHEKSSADHPHSTWEM
jgi:hypothetical protein